jgi:separase
MANLRAQFDKIFQRGLRSQEKKPKVPVRLHDTLLECFSSLSPKCRDEELEDLVYFVLDLYQFHGIAVATAEVDVDQIAVDLRIALEAHSARAKGKVVSEKDSHMFLVLDKNVQEIPWESIPILRGRNVSRIPSIEFLVDRIELAKRGKGRVVDAVENDDTVAAVHGLVDPRKTYYVLNPSGDLGRTEGRFAAWLKNMHKVGWKGLVGRPPSEQQFLDALRREDLVM